MKSESYKTPGVKNVKSQWGHPTIRVIILNVKKEKEKKEVWFWDIGIVKNVSSQQKSKRNPDVQPYLCGT